MAVSVAVAVAVAVSVTVAEAVAVAVDVSVIVAVAVTVPPGVDVAVGHGGKGSSGMLPSRWNAALSLAWLSAESPSCQLSLLKAELSLPPWKASLPHGPWPYGGP